LKERKEEQKLIKTHFGPEETEEKRQKELSLNRHKRELLDKDLQHQIEVFSNTPLGECEGEKRGA